MNTVTVSDVVAARVREVRTKRGISPAGLAERCTALGMTRFTAQSVYKIEAQRESTTRPPRRLTVDELLCIAEALNVAPVHLLVPPDEPDAPYPVTPRVTESRSAVRAWIRGQAPLGGADPRDYYAELPGEEFSVSVSVQARVATAGAVVPTPAVQTGPGAEHQESEDR